MDTIPFGVGNRIRYYRLRRGWNQKRFAQILGIDPGTLSAWEYGHTEPSIRSLRRIAVYLGVTCGQLLD